MKSGAACPTAMLITVPPIEFESDQESYQSQREAPNAHTPSSSAPSASLSQVLFFFLPPKYTSLRRTSLAPKPRDALLSCPCSNSSGCTAPTPTISANWSLSPSLASQSQRPNASSPAMTRITTSAASSISPIPREKNSSSTASPPRTSPLIPKSKRSFNSALTSHFPEFRLKKSRFCIPYTHAGGH